MRNRVLLVLLIAVLLLVHPASGHLPGPLDTFGSTSSQANAFQLRTIIFPVAGPAAYNDTFGACRDGCTRSHQGVDIFAPKLTPLIAAADGRIVSERRNATNKAGNKLVIEDAAGWRYVYLHLNNDTPGTDDNANPQSWIAAGDLRAGDTVRAGQVIGYLGDSGNAEETPPHLHFEIIPPGESSINPTPAVTAARGRGDLVAAGELWLSDDIRADWETIVDDAYQDLAGRPPTGDERDSWTNRLALGLGTENDLIADLAMAAPYREPEGMALRAYVVTFGRVPSETVLRSLADDYRDGGSTDDLAALIVDSIDYEELRPSDPGSNLDRDDIAELADSIDVKHETWHLLQIVRAYRAAAGRLPTAAEIDAWTEYLQRGGLQVDVVAGALEGAMPSGEPRNAGVFTPTELGYRPGETVRQGPMDLDPSTDPGDGGVGTRTFGEPDFDVDLTVDEDEDGTDVASLTVRIPIDELAANSDGDAEITIELQLTPGVGIDGEAEASADIDVVTSGSAGDDADAGDPDDTAAARAADDDDSGPPVSPPTTRRPTPRPPSAPQPAPAPAPPSPSPATTQPAPVTTQPAPAPSPEPSSASTSASTTTTADQPGDDGQPTTTCVTPTTAASTDESDGQPTDSSIDTTATTGTSCEGPADVPTDDAADAGTDGSTTTESEEDASTDATENPDGSDVAEGTEGEGDADSSDGGEPVDGQDGPSTPGADDATAPDDASPEAPADDPATDDPATGDPADGDPADGDPADGDTADGDTADGDTADGGGDTAGNDAASDDPAADDPATDDTGADADDTATDDPDADNPDADGEDADDTATDDTVTDDSTPGSLPVTPDPAAVSRVPAVHRWNGSRRRRAVRPVNP